MPLASIADLNGSIEEVTKGIALASTLSDAYDDFIVMEQESNERAPGIHASELYPCLRKPMYSLRDVPKQGQIAKFWKQRFKVGHALHDMVQSDFERFAKRSRTGQAMRAARDLADAWGCVVEFNREVEIHPRLQPLAAKYRLHSSCDGVFTFRDKASEEVLLRLGLEIKTEAPNGYEELKAPKAEHIRQVMLYMAVLDLPLLWFFYMNKGNQNNTTSRHPFLIIFDPTLWADIEARCQYILDNAEKEDLPERTEGIHCEFCPWSYTCKPDTLVRAVQRRAQYLQTKRPLIRGQ